MSRNRKMWVVVMGLGVVMILAGVAWIIYSVAGTSTHYDASTGDYVSDSAWPIVGFFVSFAGGTLISVGMLGWMFSWFSRHDDDDRYTSSAATLRQAVPTTRVGWGPYPEEQPPGSR
jgi:ABC-type Fe3+ transport system permease subunit